MNNVTLIGRLTKDLELRKSQTGMSILRFTLAVNRRVPNKQTGQREADFISCVAFGKTAEIMSTYLAKGSQVGIEGRIQTGNYDDANGNRVYTTDVIVDNFDFIDSKNANQGTQPNANQGYQQQGYQQQQAPSRPQQVQPQASNNDFFSDFETSNSSNNILDSLNVSDDELPF